MPNIQLEAQPRKITIVINEKELSLYLKAGGDTGFNVFETTMKNGDKNAIIADPGKTAISIEKPIGYAGGFNAVGDAVHFQKIKQK